MNWAKYPSEAENKAREDFLENIPLPDEAFLAAAKRAVISAGLPDEVVKTLHPDPPEDGSPRPRPQG